MVSSYELAYMSSHLFHVPVHIVRNASLPTCNKNCNFRQYFRYNLSRATSVRPRCSHNCLIDLLHCISL